MVMGLGLVNLAIRSACPRQASHFLYVQCNSGSSFLLVCSPVSLLCSLQHHLSAKRMLLIDRSKGKEDVLWCPEGHLTKAKASKCRLFGKCLHFWASYCLNLGNCFGWACKILAVFSTSGNLQS